MRIELENKLYNLVKYLIAPTQICSVNRRTFLATAGASVSVFGGGCLSLLDDSSIRLGFLDVGNFDSESHEFDVRVKRDGAQVHSSSHVIGGKDGNVVHGEAVECTWGRTAGEYRISARVDSNEWKNQSLLPADTGVSSETDCVVVGVWYRFDGLEFQIESGCNRDYDGMCSFTSH